MFLNCFFFVYFVVVSYGANPGSLGRRLLSSSNSTSHGPVWEDCSWEKDHLPGIWICIHFICILIIFIGKCICFFYKSIEGIGPFLWFHWYFLFWVLDDVGKTLKVRVSKPGSPSTTHLWASSPSCDGFSETHLWVQHLLASMADAILTPGMRFYWYPGPWGYMCVI